MRSDPYVRGGATADFLAGFGWVATAFGVITVFDRKPPPYALLHGAYFVVALVVMGAILGGLR
ncbi:MAG: DUF1761 domain-containing protein [Gemmatimonadota bacterium]|nr:DUF1761 domain-containing protein [Gemmatimonadota bacterium]